MHCDLPKAQPLTLDMFSHLPYKEPKRRIHFEITTDDVNAAIPNEPCHCVVAVALKEVYPNLKAVFVFLTKAYIVLSDKVLVFAPSAELGRAVSAYDAEKGWNLAPGVYYFNPLPPSHSFDGIRRKNVRNYNRRKNYPATGRNQPRSMRAWDYKRKKTAGQ
jgi:hypothetical protein